MDNGKKEIKKRFNVFDDRKYVFAAAGLIIVLFLVFYGKTLLSHVPYFKIKSIIIDGNRALKKDEVVKLLGVTQEDSIINFDTVTAIKRFKNTGIIKDIKIYTVYPNTLRVVLRERYPVACALIRKSGEDEYYLVDDEASIISGKLPARRENLPLLVLGDLKQFDKNELSENLKKTLYSLSVIYFNDKNDLKLIKKISFEPASNKVFVWVGKKNYCFIVKEFLKVRDFVEMKFLLSRSELVDRGVRKIDLRFDDIIAR